MKYTLALLSVLGTATAQGVTESIAPAGSYPDGCSKSADGQWWVSVLGGTASKRSIEERAAAACAEGNLIVSLANGVLTDSKGRTGYIAANYQFQFDAPAQTGAISTAGYCVYKNSTLALGPSTTFYQCRSGEFFNLYDRSWAAQCEAVQLAVYSCSGAGTGGSTQQPDGQVVPGAGQIPDGQIRVTQISDGQVQAPTGKPVSQIPDGQPQNPTGKPVSQIPDGQAQAPTGKPVSQIPDGQAQAPTGKPVSQIPDGQAQAPTGKPVSQISDGQVQAPTGTPVIQISDGQVQVPTPTGKPVSQISDGQAQVPTAGTTPAPSTVPTSYAGRLEVGSLAALVVGIVGAVAFF